MKVIDLLEGSFEATEKKNEKIDVFWDQDLKDNLHFLEHTFEQIKKQCKPFLNILKGLKKPALLYRGITPHRDVVGSMIFQRDTFKKRMLKDTSKFVTNIFDQASFDNFGVRFRTENIIFCSGDRATADVYGEPIAIFPVGNFKFLWSPIIHDFYRSPFYNEILDNADSLKPKDFKEMMVDDYEYTNKDFGAAMIKKHPTPEIMVQTPRYYGIHVRNFNNMLMKAMYDKKSPEYAMFQHLERTVKPQKGGPGKDVQLLYHAVTG